MYAQSVRGVGREARAFEGIEAAHRLDQADAVALLDEVEHVGPGAPVFVGHLHDQPEVVNHQLLGRHGVLALVDRVGQRLLLLQREQRVPANLPQEVVSASCALA